MSEQTVASDPQRIEWDPNDPQIIALDACFNRCGYDTSVLIYEEFDVIVRAVIDAEPNGRVAQEEAAEAALRAMALAGGWDQYLDMDE